jgi:cytosine/adenosine deaminase-related metal-dependent hydrolase
MILLKNGTFIDWQTLEFRHSDILVADGPDGPVIFNPGEEAIKAPTRVIDCTGKFITKSFANGHHHVYSALARGMPPPTKNPVNFQEILQYVWWTLDKALDLEMVRSSALVTAIACAKNGVTFVVDHHASPFALEGSLETIASAFDEVGIGHLLCYEISDRDGEEIARKGLAETGNYLAKRQGLVGLHASFTVGVETLKQAVQLAEKTGSGIHIHVAEDLSDEADCVARYGKRVVERLSDSGVLQFPKTILAHCLHLDDHERGLVEGSAAWVVQNMESNLNNSVGFFSSKGLGRRIMLGTDGMHSDMLRSAKSAFFAGHNFDSIDYGGTYSRFRNVHGYLGANRYKGDGDNNLVVLEYDSPTPLTSGNFFGHFLFGIESRHVCHVISQGRLVVRDRIVQTVDETKILEESQKQALQLWRKMMRQKGS